MKYWYKDIACNVVIEWTWYFITLCVIVTTNRTIFSGSSVAFFAFLKNDLYAVGNEVLKFADVRINKGGAFNPSRGVFTAPKQGIYQMSCTIMGFAGHEFFYLVMKNGSVYSYGTTSSGGHFNTETSLILMNLKKGDRVYIQHRHIAARIHANKNSYFSGYLISGWLKFDQIIKSIFTE